MAKSPPPTSALLQDLLREKRAAQSSPITPKPGPLPSTTPSATNRRQPSGLRDKITLPAEMGIRETDDYINKVMKENIDLKFDLFHQRRRTEELEKRLQKMENLKDDIRSLQAINEELQREIEKRNTAVQEAVNMICQHELTIEVLMSKVSNKNNVATQSPVEEPMGLDSDPAGYTPSQNLKESKSHDADEKCALRMDTKDKTVAPRNDPSSQGKSETDIFPERLKSPWRTPSFLHEHKENTDALRSLYKGHGNNPQLNPSMFSLSSPGSLYTMDDEVDVDGDQYMLNSPRLSVLSESSLFSVYRNPKKVHAEPPQNIDTVHDGPEERSSQKRNLQDARPTEAEINKWIDEKNKHTSPSRNRHKSVSIDKFSSIDEVLEKLPISSVQQRTDRTSPAGSLSGTTGGGYLHKDEDLLLDDNENLREHDEGTLRQKDYDVSRSLGRPIFSQSILPPTPDTMSTDHREIDVSTPNIVAENSLVDGSPFRPKRLHYDGPAYSHGGTPLRPQPKDYVSNMIFNRYDDFEQTQTAKLARTTSYPPPGEGRRRRSVQFPPREEISEPSHIRAVSVSPQNQQNESYDKPVSQPTSSSHRSESRLPQPTSNRFKNMLFRRSNSQNAQPSALDYTEPASARPKSRNVVSPTHPSRPSSVHFANTSKPLPDPNAPPRIGRSASARMKDGLKGIQIRK